MESNYCIKNGKIIKKEEANISVYNKALFFDFCVYSNIKVIQGKMFYPDLEAEKLFESAKAIGIEHTFKINQIIDWTRTLIKENNLKDALIRLLLVGQEKNIESELFLFPVGLTFRPEKSYNQGVKVITHQGERFFPTSKTKNLLMSYLAYNKAAKKGCMDALLVDKEGNIQEGTRTSFFAIKDSTLIAPKSEKVLEGITRKIILQIAKKILKVKEQDISLKELSTYDEVFLTGTTTKIMPINQIDDIEFKVGPKTKELQKLYKEFCEDKFVD